MGIVQHHSYSGLAALSSALAMELCARIEAANHSPAEVFTISLHGGRSAKALFMELAKQVQATSVNLEKVHLFWGDERCVPPRDPESNYLIAHEAFIEPLQLPSERVHRILGEAAPDFAAKQAEAELCRICLLNAASLPILDVVLLGMGEDGHIASIFPNTNAEVAYTNAAYVPVIGPKPPPQRISLTFPVLFAAREMHIIASGEGKRDALRRSAEQRDTPAGVCIQRRELTHVHADFAL
jgi:6-phosphogluconolactonase